MKILLIDDDPLSLLGLGAAFKRAGFEVCIAETGEEGLAKCRTCIPDLIICDVMMPLINGLQLKKRMNTDADLASIPLLFLSGRDDEADIHYAMELGAEGYLVKPLPFCAILDKVKSILRLHRRNDE